LDHRADGETEIVERAAAHQVIERGATARDDARARIGEDGIAGHTARGDDLLAAIADGRAGGGAAARDRQRAAAADRATAQLAAGLDIDSAAGRDQYVVGFLAGRNRGAAADRHLVQDDFGSCATVTGQSELLSEEQLVLLEGERVARPTLGDRQHVGAGVERDRAAAVERYPGEIDDVGTGEAAD